MGNGYEPGDECIDCYQIETAASNIMHAFDGELRIGPKLRERMKQRIKSEMRELVA